MIRLAGPFANQLGFPNPPETFVHFSWKLGPAPTSKLRNYAIDGFPSYIEALDPATVWQNISGPIVIYRKNERGRFDDDAWWHQETTRVNREFPVPLHLTSRS